MSNRGKVIVLVFVYKAFTLYSGVVFGSTIVADIVKRVKSK